MVYCAAFDCNTNSSKNKVTCSWFKFPTEPTLFNKTNVAQPALLATRKLVSTAFRTREGAALGYPGAKVSLKEDDVPTLFPVVETKRAVTELSAQIQVMAAHCEFSLVNLDSILWKVWPATLVTLASEHNGHIDLGPNDCVAST